MAMFSVGGASSSLFFTVSRGWVARYCQRVSHSPIIFVHGARATYYACLFITFLRIWVARYCYHVSHPPFFSFMVLALPRVSFSLFSGGGWRATATACPIPHFFSFMVLALPPTRVSSSIFSGVGYRATATAWLFPHFLRT